MQNILPIDDGRDKMESSGWRKKRSTMGYPAAPVASPDAVWKEAASAPFAGNALILYIHFPFCRSRCSFCPFYSGGGTAAERHDYVELLKRELSDAEGSFLSFPVNTVYFGGGTPSDLTPDELSGLLEILHRKFTLANDCEITLESRIDGLTDELIDAALAGGVNRFSLGVQTFDTELRRKLGRVSDRETVLSTIERLTARNQASVAADLLYGLPGQTPEMMLADLDTVLHETALSGLSFYRLRMHEKLELAQTVKAGGLPAVPDETACFELHRLAETYLEAAGAKRLSVKHFAFSPRERNLHNEISAYKGACLPFGAGAGGRLGNYRFKLCPDRPAYAAKVLAGIKPIENAGEFPPDYPLGAKISLQLYRRMALNVAELEPVIPEPLRPSVMSGLMSALDEQLRQGFFEIGNPEHAAGVSPLYQLTAKGRFNYAAVGSDLLEAAASAWNGVQ